MIAAWLTGRLFQLRPELVDLDASGCRGSSSTVGLFVDRHDSVSGNVTGCQWRRVS
jgi:hypothetical protein